jgi:hypothetical protein
VPTTQPTRVIDLSLDLKNFRMLQQPDETHSVQSMISANSERFWALAESLLEDGYHPTENILLLRDVADRKKLIVKEGNRRVGALKIILGYLNKSSFVVPPNIDAKIKAISDSQKKQLEAVPCAIYEAKESDVVDRIITLTHGKGEQASRDQWNSVAKARHNRDSQGGNEPALDLLENYLKNGKNVTPSERERWGGEFNLTVLEEALQKLASRLGSSTRELVDSYPSKHRNQLESLLHDIGHEVLRFQGIRNTDFGTSYGFPAPPVPTVLASTSTSQPSLKKTTSTTSGFAAAVVAAKLPKKPIAVATNDARSVIVAIKKFIPKGKDREKLVTLLHEAQKLDLKKHPHAFCFLLRSMFEISAKAYCGDYAADGLSAIKASGEDRKLIDVLRDVTDHLTKKNADNAMVKMLHGALVEMAEPAGFLSVTSMNQLVHNKTFSVNERHISTLFGNIFPLLLAMNS